MHFNRGDIKSFEKATLTIAAIESIEISAALIKIIDLRPNGL